MAKQQRTWGILVIQISLAIYMVVTGLCLFGVGSSISSNEIATALQTFGKVGKVLGWIIGVFIIVCGVLFLIKTFGLVDFGRFNDVLKYGTLALWCVITIFTLVTLYKELASRLIYTGFWFLLKMVL